MARRGPRMCLEPEHRRLFGSASKVIWLEDVPPSLLAAAYRQHLVSLAVKKALAGQTIDQLATIVPDLGKVDTLRRKLRGEDWMSLADVAALEIAFPSVREALRQAPLLPV